MSSRPSKKRRVDNSDNNQTGPKIHPFFSKAQDPSNVPFQWIKPSLGPKHTCLHGINSKPECYVKVAAFDLDGTLIKAGSHGLKWEWWRAVVPSKLKAVHDAGFSVVIMSNQAIGDAAMVDWKKKVALIAAGLPDLPFRLFAAKAKDGYRKPCPGMWFELERIFKEENVTIDKSASFFVGDAAGRPGDFAATDRKFALNIGILFFTPEEYYLDLPARSHSVQSGFHPSSLPNLPLITPTSSPILPVKSKHSKADVVLFYGYPCLGKTTFFRKYFQTAGYVHINQDTLRTRDKCIKRLQQALDAGTSCVIDNTNRDAQTRKYYIDLAKKDGCAVRCFWFTGSKELAWHNNLYRAFNLPQSLVSREPERELLPYSAFSSFEEHHEEPSLEEDFSEVKKVNWVFDGDEEARWRWNMWLQIDGRY